MVKHRDLIPPLEPPSCPWRSERPPSTCYLKYTTGNPGRPIISSYNSPTERISAYVDHHLQPLVKQLDSHIKDTHDFLDKLKNLNTPLPPGTILVTIDVTSLYTNIPTPQGLAAMEAYLYTRPANATPSTQFLIGLARMILTLNNFTFQEKHYLQVKGTAMGTRMAPSYANLFMGKIETDFLAGQPLTPTMWLRFIDDIFAIWTHGLEALLQCLDTLNSIYPVKFTWTISEHHVTFLDVDVFLEEGLLRTNVHFKPTNSLQYLHFDSCHPSSMKQALPFSMATRGRRICSNKEDLAAYCDKITKAFVNRGYPPKLVKLQMTRTPNRPATSTQGNIIPLITQWHPGLQALNGIIKRNSHLLQTSALTQHLDIPRVTFKRPPNIQDLLVKRNPWRYTNEPPGVGPPGSYPCDSTRCKTCPLNLPTESFAARATNNTYTIQGHNTCKTSNVVYQLRCSRCPAEYIGLTTNALNIRMNGHRHDTKAGNIEKPVALHAASHNLSFNECFQVSVVRALPTSCNEHELRRWELAHQWITSSRLPPNLNIR